jgi:hypothetical protein
MKTHVQRPLTHKMMSEIELLSTMTSALTSLVFGSVEISMSRALTNTCVFVTSQEDVTANSARILHSSTNHKQGGEDPKPKKKREKKKKAKVGEKTAQTRARKERNRQTPFTDR